ncbi:dGTPase [Helicobacter pametensis]|uniref:dGTPase n=1 Tax=Helicobacter pametensis TaxID=95149 RepID=UPI0004AD3D45|nr:dGTPase [Helicobacter pametensis]
MYYERKIKTTRVFQNEEQKKNDRIEISTESDRGRILNCSAIRRLQQRTQVFPLEEDATIRSRLTHSLEVQQTGRYIAREILKQATQNNVVLFETDDPNESQNYRDAFISLVEMACLLHDIGNPPFGHFGEKAIQDWANENLDKIFEESIPNKSSVLPVDRNMLLLDLKNFDGNAQGIRLVTSLQQLNLTYSQIASFLKYTRGAFEEGKREKIDKKPGFFFSEKEIVEKIYEELNMDLYHRFPLVYIMEAADDICYSIADLDDALDKGIIKIVDFLDYLRRQEQFPKTILEEIEKDYQRSKEQRHNNPNAYFMILLRVKLQKNLVPEIAKHYLINRNEIFMGKLDCALIDTSKKHSAEKREWFDLLELMQNFAREQIFTNKKICEMELKGYKIIHSLLEIFKPVLKVPLDVFKDDEKFRKQYPLQYRLYNRLPKKYQIAYKNAQNDCKNHEDIFGEYLELYYRTRLIFDYISGMTDNFALKEHQLLTGIQ